jgi:hypothetical protein
MRQGEIELIFKVMKKIIVFSSLLIVILICSFQRSTAGNPSPLGIGIDFSSKAYWDGPSQSCLPREKGCCFHISFDFKVLAPGHIYGTLETRQNNELAFSFSKKGGLLPETWKELVRNGYFVLDGDGTFSEDLLKKLGLPANFKLSEGKYSYTENGDIATVIFK